jgi:hypothetical protein
MDGTGPAVLASIFTYEYQGQAYCKHECISLSEKPMTASLNKRTVWSPQKPGVIWKPVEDSVAPAESLPRRLTQMRNIARQFSGKVIKPTGEITQLQLLPQPLVRYQSPEHNVVDGAIFSMAVVTDPELLLVIEAYQENEVTAWRYCPLRSHYWQLELTCNGKSVWTADLKLSLESAKFNQSPESGDPYFTFASPYDLPLPEKIK